ASGTIVSVTDTSGNVYAVGAPVVRNSHESQAIYYARNIVSAGAQSNTVTVIFSASVAYPDIRVLEYSGIDRTNPLDGAASGSGTGSNSTSGSIVTTNAFDLLIGANDVSSLTSGAGAGYTTRVLTSPDGDIVEDRVVTAAGAYNATAPIAS